MKLWYFTANPSQQSRCGEIGLPLEVKNVDYKLKGHGGKKGQIDLPQNLSKTRILLSLYKH